MQSTLQGVSLEPGQYYIVVDGFGGQEGQYEINITQSGLHASEPSDIYENIMYEEEKSALDIDFEDWNFSDGNQENNHRNLLGFSVYRDNAFIASVGPDVYSYLDLGLENGTELSSKVIQII